MNVKYDNFSATDVAKILGVYPQTVANWCRQGHINYINVGEGAKKARYMFTDAEVTRVQKLVEKYGKNAWTRHSREVQTEPVETLTPCSVHSESAPGFDVDGMMDDIVKLQYMKQRVETIEAEQKRLEDEKQEILKTLDSLRDKIVGTLY